MPFSACKLFCGQYVPGFSAGKVARLSQALPHVTGGLGVFFYGVYFFPTRSMMCMS